MTPIRKQSMTSAAQDQGISIGSKEEPVIASDKSQSLVFRVQRPCNFHAPRVCAPIHLRQVFSGLELPSIVYQNILLSMLNCIAPYASTHSTCGLHPMSKDDAKPVVIEFPGKSPANSTSLGPYTPSPSRRRLGAAPPASTRASAASGNATDGYRVALYFPLMRDDPGLAI
jgi:hypothetical protein